MRYGEFGGTYVPELLMTPLEELQDAFEKMKNDRAFIDELDSVLATYAGRPTPLTEVTNFARAIGAGRVYLKREDLLHTGAHKLNNALGQVMLAKVMGKEGVIAETGAGQHGVATATACARLGLRCHVFMGAKDMARQAPNVKRMHLLGAKVTAVEGESATLKEAVNEAMREWSRRYEKEAYCLGSALGPHPYPAMVGFFQRVIGREAKEQLGHLPDVAIACVGGGSNAIGLFSAFIDDKSVQLIGVEPVGAARFAHGSKGVLHGSCTYVLQDADGQISPTHSIAAGLDYPSVGPEHAHLYNVGRASYVTVDDEEVKEAFTLLSRTEGIIPALESSHALAYAMRADLSDQTVVINLSGRGDKDL